MFPLEFPMELTKLSCLIFAIAHLLFIFPPMNMERRYNGSLLIAMTFLSNMFQAQVLSEHVSGFNHWNLFLHRASCYFVPLDIRSFPSFSVLCFLKSLIL